MKKKQITNKQALTKIKKFLLKQNKRSEDSYCSVYVSHGGLRCSLGVLMEDLTYSSWRAMRSRNTLQAYRDKFISDNNLDEDLMSDLEELHDCTEPETWKQGFKDIAEKYKKLL